MAKKPKGWRQEPRRHSLAARGIKTKKQKQAARKKAKYWKGIHANQPESEPLPGSREKAKQRAEVLRARISKNLYKPTPKTNIRYEGRGEARQPDIEELEIVVPTEKMHEFDFMLQPEKYPNEWGMGRTKVAVNGDWISKDDPPASWDVNAKNTVIKVQFTETKGNRRGKQLIKDLNEYNELVVGEQMLYSKTSELGESSL